MTAATRPRILGTSIAAALALFVGSSTLVQADTLVWTGMGGDNTWENPGNWIPNITPGGDPNDPDLIFQGNNRTVTFNNNGPPGNSDIQSIQFSGNAGKFILGGNGIFMDGGGYILNNSRNLQIISFTNFGGFGGIQLNAFNFNSNLTIPTVRWIAAQGDMLFATDVTFNTPLTLIFDGAHDTTLLGQLSNVALGDGYLLKIGTGSVFLNGISYLTGDTMVSAGTLYVNGSTASRQTYVNFNGTLAGTGTIGGNVNNAGNVQPGGTDSTGRLTVLGNYAQTGVGRLTIGLGGKGVTEHGSLAIVGQALLGGKLRLVDVGGGKLRIGEKVTILSANGGVIGKFSSVNMPLAHVGYHSTFVTVNIRPIASLTELTPNQRAVGAAIDNASRHGHEGGLVSLLLTESIPHLQGDLDRIAPEELTSVYTMGVALANVQSANLQRRMDDIRFGSHGFSASGFAAAGSGPLYSGAAGVAGPDGATGDDGKESKEMKEIVPSENRWGVFITGVGEWVNVSGTDNARGYNVTTGGFTVGADYKVTPNFAVGINAGYAGTSSDLTQGGRVYVNGGKLGLYSTYFTGGFYVDTAVNGGYNSYDTHRAALAGSARGDTDGGELNVLVGTGYDWKIGGFTFGPTASFQYTYLGLDSFDEHGSLLPLSFPSQHQESLRSAFGFKASYDWKLGGIVVKPELRAAWQHEYGDNTYSLASTFDGPHDLFRVSGPRIGRDSLLLGAGFAVLWNERTSTYFYYDGELGRENYESNAVSGGVRLSF